MNLDDIRLIYDYETWAMERLQSAFVRLSDDDFLRPLYLEQSLRDILMHIVDARFSWRELWAGRPDPGEMDVSTVRTAGEFRSRWRDEVQEMNAWLDGLTDADIQRPLQPNERWQPLPLWQLMLHVANHGTQHRSEVALLLTNLGASPGDLDLSMFLKERNAPTTTA